MTGIVLGFLRNRLGKSGFDAKALQCANDAERLDVFNGFLLVANLDALFDRFLISFDNTGRLLVSSALHVDDQHRLGLQPGMKLRWLGEAHRGYLAWHRKQWEEGTGYWR